jgi:S-adenosylmethionine hydrolase
LSIVFDRTTRLVDSSNGVHVVTYDEVAVDSGAARNATARMRQPALLFSHATGFHGRVFAPVAAQLSA